jgi:transposase-like protein
MTPDPIYSCPACESGELRPGPFLVLCSSCDYALSRDHLLVLRQIRALPEAQPARQRVAEHPGQDESGR